MADQIFLNPGVTTSQAVKVGGVCYYKVGPSAVAPDTLSVDGSFDSCESCSSGPCACPTDWQTRYSGPYSVMMPAGTYMTCVPSAGGPGAWDYYVSTTLVLTDSFTFPTVLDDVPPYCRWIGDDTADPPFPDGSTYTVLYWTGINCTGESTYLGLSVFQWPDSMIYLNNETCQWTLTIPFTGGVSLVFFKAGGPGLGSGPTGTYTTSDGAYSVTVVS